MEATGELIERLMEHGTTRSLGPDETLCREGDESDDAYVVLTGELEAVLEAPGGSIVIARHGPGALVGEVTALVGGVRTATLRAPEATTVSVVPGDELAALFSEEPDQSAHVLRGARDRTDRNRVAALLAQELDVASPEVITELARRVTWVTVPAGGELFRAGDSADAAYLVVSGRFEAVDNNDDRLADLARGEIVGDFGLLQRRPRSATVRAIRDSLVARLSATDFESIAASDSRFAMGLVRRALDRAEQADSRRRQPTRSVAVVITAPVDPSTVLSTMGGAVSIYGSTLQLSSGRVDRLLRQDGIAQTEPGLFGEVRLAELLHQAEVDHDHVFLQADPISTGSLANTGATAWTRRVMGRADRVIIVASASPGAGEQEALDAVLSAAPEIVPVWLALIHPDGAERPSQTSRLSKRHAVSEVHHLRDLGAGELGRLARLAAGRGTALVLSGGGGRGFAHLGAIRALEEFGVEYDRIVGASMGSVVAAIVGQGLAPEARVEFFETQFAKLLDYTIPVVSLVKGERISANIERQFGDWDIEDMWLPFACVSTNLTTSQIVEHRQGSAALAVRASVAIPGILPPVPDGEHLLVDGGVLDNLPVSLVEDDPSIETIIASDVTPPGGPRAKSEFGLSVSGWQALRAKVGRGDQQYPRLADVLMRSMLIASTRHRDRYLQADAIDLYLDANLRGVGLLEFDSVRPVADRGYEAARERVREFAASRPVQ